MLILQPNLRPKWSWLEPSDRKCKGSPTERRVVKLKEKAKEIDDHPFVDKAEPRPPLRFASTDWDSAPEKVMSDALQGDLDIGAASVPSFLALKTSQ
jgi:hypothetical protein